MKKLIIVVSLLVAANSVGAYDTSALQVQVLQIQVQLLQQQVKALQEELTTMKHFLSSLQETQKKQERVVLPPSPHSDPDRRDR